MKIEYKLEWITDEKDCFIIATVPKDFGIIYYCWDQIFETNHYSNQDGYELEMNILRRLGIENNL